MRLFKKRDSNKPSLPLANKLWEGIEASFTKMQQAWAKWMEHRTENLSHNQWLMVLGLFVLLTGGYSSYLISAALLSKGRMIFSITSIQKPITVMLDVTYRPPSVLTEKGDPKVNRFQLYMDSLKSDSTGNMECDKIILDRPGLLDSLEVFETNHNQN